jgi:methylenetetrahydrofolate reductase (NADPH)
LTAARFAGVWAETARRFRRGSQRREAMRLDEVIQNSNKPTLSFELFPAHDDKAKAKLDKVIDKLTALEPNFVSVTFGAGGSTREGSYQLAKQLKEDKNLKVLPYFAGFGLGPNDICAVLNRYRDLGIENLLVVRGDRPAEDEGFSPHPQSFKHASDLLGFIGERYAFCLGAAGYPEGHVEASSKEKDLEYLKLKTQKGASFVIANYFYDNRYFFDFIERVRKIGVTAPILAGVMPIYNVKMMENLASLCGATITSEIREARPFPTSGWISRSNSAEG